MHGNAERVLKDVSELAPLDQNLKQTVYDYELISGNVNKVIYQPGQADQFIHSYDYDADNRLVHTLTSHQGLIYHQDEKQFYYLHGPTARTEIGEHKVQGQDYIYTIHGWLKGVNASVLDRRKDAGKDGRRESLYLNGECTIEQYSPNDAGKDLHSRIGADAFGFALSYYNTPAGQGNPGNRDYISIKGNLDPEPDNWFTTASTLNLYNGNIKQMSVALMKGNSMTGVNTGTVTPNMPYAGVKMELLQWQYTYDQLQRLTNATAFTGTSTSTYTGHNDVNEYKNLFSYDANGNILTQLRNGNAATLNLDNLTYNYQNNASTGGATNQLASVTENLAQSNNTNHGDDYDNVSRAVGCTYDEIGNLKTDARHFITEIKWNVYGKVSEVIKNKNIKFDDWDNNGTQNGAEPAANLSDIEYRYNEEGLRIVKITKPHHATLNLLTTQDNWKYTYYSYDADGNVQAVYERDYTAPTGTPQRFTDKLKLEEHHIYSDARVGIANYDDTKVIAEQLYDFTGYVNTYYLDGTTNGAINTSTLTVSNEKRTLGTRMYELVNHLGGVVVVVSDKKIPVFESVTVCTTAVTHNNTFTHYTADVQSVVDVSAYGVELQNRTFNSPSYRYGFNGNEKEIDVLGKQGAFSAEFWMYDAHLGRRWEQDPMGWDDESPYMAFSGNPVMYNDPLGLMTNKSTPRSKGNSHKSVMQKSVAQKAAEQKAPYTPAKQQASPGQSIKNNPHQAAGQKKDWMDGVKDAFTEHGKSYEDLFKHPLDLLKGLAKHFGDKDTWIDNTADVLTFGLYSTTKSLIELKQAFDEGDGGYELAKRITTKIIEAGEMLLTEGVSGAVSKGLGAMGKTLNKAKNVIKTGKIGKALTPTCNNNAGKVAKALLLKVNCFVAGTLILTKDGYKNIEDIAVGDSVWSFNEETGSVELAKVTALSVSQTDNLVVIYVASETIMATPEHPFYINNAWKEAKELRTGDSLTLRNGQKLVINRISLKDTTAMVYNFTVENTHTYYITNFSILVHNLCWQERLKKFLEYVSEIDPNLLTSQESTINHLESVFKALEKFNPGDRVLQLVAGGGKNVDILADGTKRIFQSAPKGANQAGYYVDVFTDGGFKVVRDFKVVISKVK